VSSFALQMAMAPRVALEVSPAQIAFSEMLALPCAAMETLVERELCATGALERLEAGECPICRGSWRPRCPVCASPGRRADATGDAGDVAAPDPDADALLRAVRVELEAADAALAESLVDDLDEHGLLDRSCAELAEELGVSEAAVARVLDVIRRVGPPGVGAHDISECLLFQLEALGLADDDGVVHAVIADHLPALARGRFASIARTVGVPRARIEAALELIRNRLRPYPAFDGRAQAVTAYVIPDVLVRAREDEFTVELVEPAMTRLAVRRGAPDAARARAFLAQLQDRWNTLRRVAEYTIEHQRAFLLEGPTALRPLTRAEVAFALDMHESTVSRAIAGKYALLPGETIVPLACFFGVSGGVDGELRRLLESASGPLSDQRLTELLRQAGYPIARRTVAKHRQRLGFNAAAMR
jgi:RNA polymerase sigma-54 factor